MAIAALHVKLLGRWSSSVEFLQINGNASRAVLSPRHSATWAPQTARQCAAQRIRKGQCSVIGRRSRSATSVAASQLPGPSADTPSGRQRGGGSDLPRPRAGAGGEVLTEAEAAEDQQALAQGEADVAEEILPAQTEAAREVMAQSGEEKDKPKFVAFDYGFQAAFLRESPSVPSNVIRLAFENFGREYEALRQDYLFTKFSDVRTDNVKRSPLRLALAYAGRALVGVVKAFDKVLTLYDGLPEVKQPKGASEVDELRVKLKQLTLSNDAVWEREHARPPVEAPWGILVPYYALCFALDVIFNGRPIQRFWFLETVARMPYFSYISMLHLYETLGWWRVGAQVRKVHFAEEWNEMHHLKIMESLGGDRLWIDRFFAQHAAFFYYWILNFMFLISPRVAYNFSELIEMHAVDTYGTFVDENEELLKTLPPSPVAVSYYYGEDLYMFDEFQTSRVPESRRPPINNLYDVFCAIRDDENEHVKTMEACQEMDAVVVSPNARRASRRNDGSTSTEDGNGNGNGIAYDVDGAEDTNGKPSESGDVDGAEDTNGKPSESGGVAEGANGPLSPHARQVRH